MEELAVNNNALQYSERLNVQWANLCQWTTDSCRLQVWSQLRHQRILVLGIRQRRILIMSLYIS